MMEQRTDAWREVRLGKATASRIADIVGRTKTGGYASGRANYKAQLVRERLLGVPEETFTNAAMQWGIDKEPEARRAYEFHADCDVTEVGFIDHPKLAMAGCSPDGLIGTDGMVELKCPIPATHQDILLGKAFPDKYVKQALWQMACTGRQYCDLVSYDPRWPEAMRLFVQRIERDEDAITSLELEVALFLKEVGDTVDELTTLYATQMEIAA
jgi:putative phage-type endonuclease